MTDIDILHRLQQRDESALRDLQERYGDKLYRSAYRALGSREDAEELVQDVLWRAWKAAPKFRGDATLNTWLYAIMKFGVRSILRVKKQQMRRQSVTFNPATMDQPTSGAQHAALVERAYQDVLRTLPIEEQRTVELLRTGHTWQETMRATGVAKITMWRRLNHARECLTPVRHAV